MSPIDIFTKKRELSVIKQSKEMSDDKTPDDLINWAEVSRYLVGSKETIRRHSIPKKHMAAVDKLRNLIRQWQSEVRKKE